MVLLVSPRFAVIEIILVLFMRRKAAAFRLINNTKMISITANLGDTKSTITHPASTTHARLSDDERLQSSISDSLIRISVGLEDISDIIADLKP